MANQYHCWAVIPAAGAGKRMSSDIPKQYISLGGKTVLEHSLEKLLHSPDVAGAVVAVSEGDVYWQDLNFQHDKPVYIAPGGKERADSVLSALKVLSQTAGDDDWVLVHDAARPCVRHEDIDKLIQICIKQGRGGILAVPVKDTIKRTNQSVESELPEIMETVDRSQLWHAQTPQMFRLGDLRDNLAKALESGAPVTDEASAMEWAGHRPVLVEGHGDNMKITRQEDIHLAQYYLDSMQ
ncbi:2-C-methyl-D-erythritol 4-phosphate cytidylyltransferase [Kaarinaea lacus]